MLKFEINEKILLQGKKSAKHSFCDPKYERAKSELEGKVFSKNLQMANFFSLDIPTLFSYIS